MGTYGIVLDQFWTSGTKKAIYRDGGKDALILALYLMSCPDATMIGLYRLTPATIAEQSGLTLEEAYAAFMVLEHHAFAAYDLPTEYVWVREMAKYRMQLTGEPVPRKDKRLLGAQRLFDRAEANPFLLAFYERYRNELRLVRPIKSRLCTLQRGLEGAYKPLPSPMAEAPCKPLTSPLQGASKSAEAPSATAENPIFAKNRIKGSVRTYGSGSDQGSEIRSGIRDLSTSQVCVQIAKTGVVPTHAIARARDGAPADSSPSGGDGTEQPARIGFGATPKGHQNCRPPCGRICLSQKQHAYFVDRFGINTAAVNATLDAFYAEVRAALPPVGTPFGDEPWGFWLAHFRARFGEIAPKPAVPSYGISRKTANNREQLARFVKRGDAS